jgi:hypothetical protein
MCCFSSLYQASKTIKTYILAVILATILLIFGNPLVTLTFCMWCFWEDCCTCPYPFWHLFCVICLGCRQIIQNHSLGIYDLCCQLPAGNCSFAIVIQIYWCPPSVDVFHMLVLRWLGVCVCLPDVWVVSASEDVHVLRYTGLNIGHFYSFPFKNSNWYNCLHVNWLCLIKESAVCVLVHPASHPFPPCCDTTHPTPLLILSRAH